MGYLCNTSMYAYSCAKNSFTHLNGSSCQSKLLNPEALRQTFKEVNKLFDVNKIGSFLSSQIEKDLMKTNFRWQKLQSRSKLI